ncbi:hypothetical protein Anapl_15145 [Anas platyrhynchos]|uniref:Uncharacterized protein n=1 Tax=Anas platyrhynchos TaxID=8839 RepID=R0JSB5_ANAPL|nr:hypothetical protein Anapl_15145 [Anas platyrhynchos]
MHNWSGAPAAGRCLGQGDPDTSGRGGAEPEWRCAKGAAPQQSFHIPALAHGAWHEAHAVPAPSTSHPWHRAAAQGHPGGTAGAGTGTPGGAACTRVPLDSKGTMQLHVAALGFPARGAAGSSGDGPRSQDRECR